MSKRFFCIFLSLLMLISITPMTVLAQNEPAPNEVAILTEELEMSGNEKISWDTHVLTNTEEFSTSANDFLSHNQKIYMTEIEPVISTQEAMTTMSIQPMSTSSAIRYSVLVLDTSGSMSGTPLTRTKQAAVNFCEQVLASEGENYVAVISFNTTASAVHNFSDDLGSLTSSINGLYSTGSTSQYRALVLADTLLENINVTGAIKNIVLMSDGLPEAGEYSFSGPYVPSDYSYGYHYANAAYAKAQELKPKYSIYSLGFFHSLSGNNLTFGRRFMNDLQNAGYYDVVNPDDLEFIFGDIADDIINPAGSFKYAGYIEQNQDSSARYNYDDAFFLEDSRTYNPQLATMSLCYELSSWSSYDADDWMHKSKNARELLTGEVLQSDGTYAKKSNGIGFKEFAQNSTWNQAPTTNSIGLVAANKTIIDDNDGDREYTLIAVAVRGGGYFSEWGGNFNVGSTGPHTGFDLAKTETLTFIEDYISSNNISGDIKLWIVGFSRAGATANLAAGAINDGHSFSNVTLANKDLFCYTFEAPQGILSSQANQSAHTNIHNVINLNDPVPMVAFSAWKFQRYNASNDYILPSIASSGFNGTNGKLDNMLTQFEVLGYSRSLYNIIETTRTLEVNVNWSKILPGGDPFIAVDLVSDRGMTNNQMLQGLMTSFATTAMVNRSNYASTFQTELVNFMDIAMAQGKEGLVDELFTEILEGLARNNNKEFKHIIAPLKSINPFYSASSRLNDVKKRLSNHISVSAANKGLTLTPGFLNSLVDSLAALINFDDGMLLLKASDNVAIQKANIIQPHWPEISLAWLMSQDTSYTSGAVYGSSSSTVRIVYINCPVDVSVYDGSNTLVTSIIGDQPSDGTLYSAVNENGEKVLFLPSDEDYTFDMTATGNGSMTCTISEYNMLTGTVNRLLSYYDLPIESGNSFLGIAPPLDQSELENGAPYGSAVAYRLLDGNENELTVSEELAGEIVDDNYFAVSVEADNGSGFVSGGGVFLKGTFAQVKAQPLLGSRLLGWYVDDEFVSSNEVYRFAVTEDVDLVAKFTPVDTHKLIITSTIGGTVTGASGSYVSGTELEIIAEASAHYRFKNWTSSNGGTFTDVNSLNTTFTMPSNATIVTANFEYVSSSGGSGNSSGGNTTTPPTIDDEKVPPTEIPTDAPWANPFTDVSANDWFYEAVKYAHQKGLVNGTSATTFSPQVTMTRGMMVTILWNYSDKPQTGNAVFTDVADDMWYADAVNWAAANGIVSGYGNGLYGPNDEITREQMAAMLYNYTKFIKADLPEKRVGAFVDDAKISSWAKEAVDAMYSAEILNGKGNNDFDPLGRAIRAEVVTMMMNFLEAIKN